VVLALGIIGSSVYKSQVEQVLNVGDSVIFKGYTLTYNGFDDSVAQKSGGVQRTITTNMDLSGRADGSIHPSMILRPDYIGQIFIGWKLTSNKVAIRSTLIEDYYVIFEDFDGTTNQGRIMVLINPLVQWIWIGGVLLLIGGLVSYSAIPRNSLTKIQIDEEGV
jgi:cytochrome c-type biogenesis protein CcmF